MKLFLMYILFTFSAGAVNKEKLELQDVDSPEEAFIERVKGLKAEKLSDLVHLSPFSDVVVIQRRFMPKTGRVAVSLAASFTLSSEFFLNPGFEGHLTYNFLEKHGIELSGYKVFTFNRGVTDDILSIGANVSELRPIAQGFFGITYKWMPVYGKIALYNRRILAFDTFFNIGGGMSALRRKNAAQVIWEPAVILGVGQVFAITRDLGLRWDLRWHMTIETQGIKPNVIPDILFSLGLSHYYPSAGLR